MRDEEFPALPDGLPDGRLISSKLVSGEDADRSVLWVSDEPLARPGELWRRLYGERGKTGLYPLILRSMGGDDERPWHAGELGHWSIEEIDALDALGVLRRFEGADVAELAAPGIEHADPDEAACRSAGGFGEALLGLVPAARGADAPALAGWDGPCNHTGTAEISAVLRSWEERFGARVVALGFDIMEVSVAAPPVTAEHALAVAAEHAAFCPDNIWQGAGDMATYADWLVDSPTWMFWWD